MHVVCPADQIEVKLAVADALRIGRPTYIRLGKKGEPQVHETPPAFTIGRGIPMRAGRDVAILSVGNMLSIAMQAAEALEGQGVSTEVVSMHTVKPLDEALLESAFADKKLVVVLEEHALAGGAGSAVLEWGNMRGVDLRKLICIAGPDRFLSACGSQNQARTEIGLTTADVVARVTSRLN
jgi:transketolase